MTTTTIYQVSDGSGLIGKNGNYNFTTAIEARNVALEFKANPRINNPNMSDDSVLYWKNRNYSIVKVITVTEIIYEIA